jgi:hypothetical protein
VNTFSNPPETGDDRRVLLLAMYLRDRISYESPTKHFLPMARECWKFMHNENNLERLDDE